MAIAYWGPRATPQSGRSRRELIDLHGERARYIAIEFARLTQDGKLVEDGKDAQFWWRVVNEVDRLQGGVRLDTGTRYHESGGAKS